MKTLIIVRHAKAEHATYDKDDFDRELTVRGREDATLMAGLLGTKAPVPDMIVCSGATRVVETIQCMMQKNSRLPRPEVNESLYLAHHSTIERLVGSVPDGINTLMICGHNPGLSDVVRHITSKDVEDIPTCSVVVLTLSCSRWYEIDTNCSVSFVVYTPKKERT
jgi:phosphohistidine phosphatase